MVGTLPQKSTAGILHLMLEHGGLASAASS